MNLRTRGLAVCAFVLMIMFDRPAFAQIGVSVKSFGALGNGSADDTVAIQAAASSKNSAIYFPPGVYKISQTISLKGARTFYGQDWSGAVIKYSGTGDAFRYNSGHINSSNGGQINIQSLQIVGTNPANQGAGIDIIAGGYAYYDFSQIRVTGYFKYGVLYDQAEIVKLRQSIIDNGGGIANSANVWITNGDEHTPGMATGFSNVIEIRDNQFDAANYGVIDDGGDNHTIEDNNFNGHTVPLRVAGATSVVIRGNTFETKTVTGDANVLLATTSAVPGGTKPDKGPVLGGVIEGNTFAGSVGPGASSMLKFTSNDPAVYHSAFRISANNFQLQLGRGAAIDVTQLKHSFVGFNRDDASAPFFHYTGVHNDVFPNTLLLPSTDLTSPDAFVLAAPTCSTTAAVDSGADGATILSPVPGATFNSPTITFTWTPATGAYNYWLDVGSSPGANDVYTGDQRMNTTSTVPLPMDGRTLYVRLRTMLADHWASREYVYTASVPPVPAQMLTPVQNTTLPSLAATFTWTPGQAVSQIWLDVGRTLGGNDIFAMDQGTGTFTTVAGIPSDGSPVYARLWSVAGGAWAYSDYVYSAPSVSIAVASLVSPTVGTVVSGSSATFTWTAGTGVRVIWLDIGKTPGGADIYGAAQGLALSHTVTGLPVGTTIYVRLWSLGPSAWYYADYGFQTR
jgi:pectate lyase-like protein